MPWIYNPLPEIQTVKALDGSTLAFFPRKKTYVRPELMSAYVWNLIREKKLANRGGDPKPPPAPRPAPAVVQPKKVETKLEVLAPSLKKERQSPGSGGDATSSGHHQSHGSVSSESSGTRSAEKESKAEKKQPDIQKKEDTQGNQDTKIEADAAEKPKKRRKRTFKKKG